MSFIIVYSIFALMTYRFPLWFPGAIGLWKRALPRAYADEEIQDALSSEQLILAMRTVFAILWLPFVILSIFKRKSK